MQVKKIISVLYLFYASHLLAVNDFYGEFTVFDVGQGNCQFVAYKDKKVGFLFDAGSSSKQKHIKLHPVTSLEPANKIFSWMEPQVNLFQTIATPPRVTRSSTETTPVSGRRSVSASKSDATEISNPGESATVIADIKKSISAVIENSGIKTLFVFLSHPDKDHINLMGEGLIPESLRKNTLVLTGGYFNKNGSDDVTTVLQFMDNKEIPYVHMYDLFLFSAIGNPYQKLKDKNKKKVIEKKANHLLQGDILEVASNVFKDSQELVKESSLFQNMYHLTPQKQKKFLGQLKKVEDRVFVWGVNYPDNDVNAQSSVVSFKLNDNSSIICTGDAEEGTFSAIRAKVLDKDDNYRKDKRKNSVVYERSCLKKVCKEKLGDNRILIVPHHGSISNESDSMAELFEPQLSIVSSGNGKQYPHPSKDMIDWLEGITVSPDANQEGFRSVGEDKEIIFYNNKDKKTYMKKSKKVVSTNFMGSLSFKEGDLFGAFSSIIKVNNLSYKINLKKSLNQDDINKKKREKYKEVEEAHDDYEIIHLSKGRIHRRYVKMVVPNENKSKKIKEKTLYYELEKMGKDKR